MPTTPFHPPQRTEGGRGRVSRSHTTMRRTHKNLLHHRNPMPSLQQPPASIPPPRRALRRAELRKIIPLSYTTIYEMEQRGEFPRRFYLTPRCVVWDSDEVYAWLDTRKQPEEQAKIGRAPAPNLQLRRRRPLKSWL